MFSRTRAQRQKANTARQMARLFPVDPILVLERLDAAAPAQLAACCAGARDVVRDGTATQRSVDTRASVVAECDALYVTRVQRERFESQALYERTKGSYVVDAALMRTAKATCAILHPLPRVDEIATDVDALPNAAYFRQMEHGLYARMAL